MSTYSLKHLHDDLLLRGLAELVASDRRNTAQLLAHLAEVEDRQLHLRAGYDSMKAYCIGELRFSDEAAAKRIHIAHVVRMYPVLLDAIAEGRIHMTGIGLIAASLTTANAGELIAAVEYKTNAQIREFLVGRYPHSEVLRFDDGVQVVAAQQENDIGHAPEHVQLSEPSARTRMTPISTQRVMVQVSIAKSTYDKLRRAQDLLGHALPGGAVPEVLDRALDALIERLEKRKIGAGTRNARRPVGARTVPAHVKRAVWERDGGRCSLVGDGGRRCRATRSLEFDHIVPVAQGGASNAANIRLLCRVHNQFAADQSFGRKFMAKKRLVRQEANLDGRQSVGERSSDETVSSGPEPSGAARP